MATLGTNELITDIILLHILFETVFMIGSLIPSYLITEEKMLNTGHTKKLAIKKKFHRVCILHG